MKNILLLNAFYCLLASLLAFVVVPIFIIGHSPEEYQFINYAIFFKTGFLFSTLLGVFLSLVCLILYLFRLHTIARFFAFFVLLWIFLTGLFMPVSLSTGMVDPENNPIDKFNLILSIIIVSSLSIAALTKVKKHIEIFVFVAILASSVFALFSIYNSNDWKDTDDSFILSNKKNILTISFDGLPGHIVNDLIRKDKKYSNALKDFVVFDNVVSQSPATIGSLMGEICGIHDFKSKGRKINDVRKALAIEGLVDNLLLYKVKDSYQYGLYCWGKRINIPSSETMVQHKIDTFDFFRYPIVRIWTRLLLKFLDWEKVTTKLNAYITNSDIDSGFLSQIRNGIGPWWDRINNIDITNYNTFVERIDVADKGLVVRYLHFSFTHYPIDFDENCNFRGDNKAWFESNQNEEGIRSQNKCALNLFSKLLTKLKKLDVYDNSLIVFKSDHGKHVYYYSEYPYNLSINGSKNIGYARYRPTLMIKDFSRNQSKVAFKSELVLLNDLAKTLCKKANLDIECKYFPGVDLLGNSLETDDPYYIYVASPYYSNSAREFAFDQHISVKIASRKVSFLEAMKDSELIKLSTLTNSLQDDFIKRLSDIEKIKKALFDFYAVNNKYPVSSDWDGFSNTTHDYIKGLVPDFLDSLPIEPRKSKNGTNNYRYKSNGKDYKFIVNGMPPYDRSRIEKKFLDPKRKWAYGIWTEGAKDW